MAVFMFVRPEIHMIRGCIGHERASSRHCVIDMMVKWNVLLTRSTTTSQSNS